MGGLHATNLDHVSVIITDLERSRRFYTDVLGLREVPPPHTFDFVVLWFEIANNQYVHLILKPNPDTISPRHFAIRVKDAIAARDHCRSHGLTVDETVRIPHADRFFITDPDGNRLEIIQWLQPYDPAAR
jgi:catechol 2,3-dioxygenase-like lactoylglutathione lyase family enzyme